MFAFSFLNHTTQWEQAPQNITVGEGQAHAEKYLADKNVAKATLRVYVTESLFTSENHTLPQDATPIFEEEVAITKGQNTLEVVTPEEPEVSGKVVPTVIGTFGTEDKVYTDGSYTVTEGQAVDGVIPVAIAIAGLKEHENANKTKGHWVGFAVTAPEGATQVKYAFSDKAFTNETELTLVNLEENVDGNGAKGIAFYADAKATAPKVYARVEWVKDNASMSETKTYKMDLTNVKVEGEDTEEPPVEPAERTEKIASTGFEAKGADADKALGITNEDGAAAHCDPNTMWAKFEGLNAEKNYTLTVKKGDAEVYTETPFPGTATKVYFTLDPELVESKPANHSIAKTAIAEGKYEFTLTEVKAQAPAGQAAETEEKPLEAKAELEIRKVTFNANGATSGDAPAAIFAALNGAITLPDKGELVKTGYTFQGWGVALNEAGKYVVTDTIELKAQWQNDNVTHAKAEVDTGELDQEVANEVKKTTVDSSAMLQDPEVLKATDELAKQIPEDTSDILTKEQKNDGNYVRSEERRVGKECL